MQNTVVFFLPESLFSLKPRIEYVLSELERHPFFAETGFRWLLNPDTIPDDGVVVWYGSPVGSPGRATQRAKGREIKFQIPAQPSVLGGIPGFLPDLVANPYSTCDPTSPGDPITVYSVEPVHTGRLQPFLVENRFGFDWIATLFFHWSRMEEYFPAEQTLNPHGTMIGRYQFLPRHGLHHQPVVDQLVWALVEILTGKAPSLRPSVIGVSHDVDGIELFSTVPKFCRYLAGVALRHRSIRSWPRMLKDFTRTRLGKAKDPGDTFDWLFHWPTSLHKTVYFGTGKRTKFDDFPDFENPRMRQILELAHSQGYQFGVHPSYDTWKNPELLKNEAASVGDWVGETIIRSRQHFLRFSFPATAEILETVGIKYDSSLGYRDLIGFRAGTGFSYRLFSFSQNRPYGWTENPLILMDTALIHEARANHMPPEVLWRNFFQKNRFNTQIIMNLHNSFFYEQEINGFHLRALLHALNPSS